MTEQQRYQVVRQGRGFELRRYPAHLVAEVDVQGSFEDAGTAAFRPLVGYIRGQNQTREGLAMTAPVLQRRDAAVGRVVGGRDRHSRDGTRTVCRGFRDAGRLVA